MKLIPKLVCLFLIIINKNEKKIRKSEKNIQIILELIKKLVFLHQRNKDKRNFN